MKKNTLKIYTTLFFVLALWFPGVVLAQVETGVTQETLKATVTDIETEQLQDLDGIEYSSTWVEINLTSGDQKDNVVRVQSDNEDLKVGDKVYVQYSLYGDGESSYYINDIVRIPALWILLGIFAFAVIAFGRWQGVRSLVALAASFAAIIFILIPGILVGWNPLLASFIVAGTILFAAIFFTHGFNRESVVAYTGTMIAVLISGAFAVAAVYFTRLSGLSAEEAVYLNFSTAGALNFTAVLLGAFIIGFLGVLDDIAITQAAVVTELYNSNPDISSREVYSRAMRVGREHVGALVNTLVLAYTGSSLPLLLYFNFSTGGAASIINLEIFATEIVRIIVGSIGLILTVPIVTFLSVKYLKGYVSKGGHHHGHHH